MLRKQYNKADDPKRNEIQMFIRLTFLSFKLLFARHNFRIRIAEEINSVHSFLKFVVFR